MKQVGDIGYLFVLVAILIYTNIYFLRSPWRSSILTKVFAAKNVLVVFLIGQVVLALYYPEYPGRDWLRALDTYLCGAAYLVLAFLLWRMQSEDRKQFASDEDEARAEQQTRTEADQ